MLLIVPTNLGPVLIGQVGHVDRERSAVPQLSRLAGSLPRPHSVDEILHMAAATAESEIQ